MGCTEIKEIQEERKKKQVMDFIFGVFKLVASVGALCMGIPDVSGIVGFADVLKAAVDNFDEIKDVFEKSVELGGAIEQLGSVEKLESVAMPSDKDWDEYISHVEVQCETLNTKMGEAFDQISAYKVAARVSSTQFPPFLHADLNIFHHYSAMLSTAESEC